MTGIMSIRAKDNIQTSGIGVSSVVIHQFLFTLGEMIENFDSKSSLPIYKLLQKIELILIILFGIENMEFRIRFKYCSGCQSSPIKKLQNSIIWLRKWVQIVF